jgi:Arc/MetJ-type ribon-helix-helix transcriptional regulator
MIKKQKPIRVHATMEPKLVEQMKSYLQEVNDDKSLKYVSASEFISEAVKQLLDKEFNNA